MIPILSVVTSVKDYLEVVHKLLEYDSESVSKYTELGPIVTYVVLSLKSFLMDFLSLSWLKNIWSLPILIPDISSAMISEISVLDGYFHNAFNFLETPTLISDDKSIGLITGLEKLTIGILNSCFLFLPTSTAHIITLRRFVMQGLEAGYISGLGTIAGNVFWLASIILGWRFFVIPWLSLDILRYILGFALLVKYMWDSYNERKMVLEDLSKRKIFLLNFLLALTEQTSIYPFVSNISISPEASILETFPADNYMQFLFIHVSYLFGIAIGSFCLLQFTCWFWENPAFKLYMWVISSFKVSTGFYYKALNFMFLYLTMLSAISSIPYYGLDYTITNPLGFVNDDRLIQDKSILETSFLGNKASDRNTRRNRGRHGRRERWKRRIRKYRTFDVSLYDQGIYDLFTIEDLNYGFDRFWLRRKLRNHRVRFRFFPGPWMRSFKKQLAKPRLESYTGPRIEFFRILFEQVYHPSFHARSQSTNVTSPFVVSDSRQNPNFKSLSNLRQARNINLMGITNKENDTNVLNTSSPNFSLGTVVNNGLLSSGIGRQDPTNQNKLSEDGRQILSPIRTSAKGMYGIKNNLIHENSMLRKFVRKLDSRLKASEIVSNLDSKNISPGSSLFSDLNQTNSFRANTIYSKRWKEIFSKIYHEPKTQIPSSNLFFKNVHRNFYNSSLALPNKMNLSIFDPLDQKQVKQQLKITQESIKKQSSRINTLSNKDLQILRYRSTLTLPTNGKTDSRDKSQSTIRSLQPFVLLHPLKFYLQQETALQRKLRYYTPNIFRKFSVENNAPYFRVMMRRYFYNYKPTNRWERTMKVGSLRKARRKTTRTPRKLRLPQSISYSANQSDDSRQSTRIDSNLGDNMSNATTDLDQRIQKPTFHYSVVSKKASRYRYQIYKDVMQHWYYSPFNRLLLKLDVDSFIRRQPKNHFLTSKEENLLHLRRFFLSEHYNTLRWYTNMEHYRTMKTKIGGSKSFSSRAYNQQFSGTFKKIRHLFAITPTINTSFPFDNQNNLSASAGASADNSNKGLNLSNGKSLGFNSNKNNPERQEETNVLKFDQPLYNEYPNTWKNPLLNPLVIHEELLIPSFSKDNNINLSASINQIGEQPSGPGIEPSKLSINNTLPSQDLLTQSQKVVREYLNSSSQVRKKYIKQLLDDKNYGSLTNFLYNGQKLRGSKPTTNDRALSYQEKDYLLTALEKEEIEKQYNSPEVKRVLRQNLNVMVSGPYISQGEKSKPFLTHASLENLYTTFLKNWKRRVNNQESLKNYLTRRIDKREKRKMTKEKTLQKKLKTLNDWASQSRLVQTLNKENSSVTNSPQSQTSEYITSGLQKAIADGIDTANADIPVASPETFARGTDILKLDPSLSESIKDRPSVKKLEILRSFQKQKLNKEIQVATKQLRTITKELQKKPTSVRTVKLMKNKISLLAQNFKKTYGGLSLLNFHQITKLVKPIKQKSLNNWRKKQRAIGKQKRLRKEFKLLLTKKQTSQQTALGIPNRKKRSDSTVPDNIEQTRVSTGTRVREGSEPSSTNTSLNLHNILANDTTENNGLINNNYAASFFNFKRERSPQRRYRVRRNRGVFRKRNLGDLMKKDIKMFFNKTTLSDSSLAPEDIMDRTRFYTKMHFIKGGSVSDKPEKDQDISLFQDSNNSTVLQFKQARVKQRKNKQRKLRSWKQKRMTLRASQKRRKYLKRRRYSISKIRVLSKQFKRVKSKLEIHNWWWKQYLPSIQASTDALWQIEKDKLIQQKLAELSPQEIIQRDSQRFNNQLQIGNKDFKPLALPEAMRIQSNLSLGSKSAQENNARQVPLALSQEVIRNNSNLSDIQTIPPISVEENKESSQVQLVNQLYENILINQNSNRGMVQKPQVFEPSSVDSVNKNNDSKVSPSNIINNSFGLLPNTSLPFYAGWDESLRKFVVTNRLLSRQDAGYEVDESFVSPSNITNTTNSLSREPVISEKQKFIEAPLKGMNAATTLYWQIPFTTYDPDQFFALGMDGFSPIGWRKMIFRHSILKTWLGDKTLRNKNTDSVPSSVSLSTIGVQKSFNHQDLLSTLQKTKKGLYSIDNRDNASHQDGFNTSRRLKKRLLRVKKHPRTPVWFPSGPLLNQVLPVHYIYVFYKRSRLPRNRYLSRRLLSVNNINNNETFNSLISDNPSFYNYDFTLRKRLKPKRKYHLKHDSSIVIPRRLKLLNWAKSVPNDNGASKEQDINSLMRWRPLSSKKINKSLSELMTEQKTLRAKRQQRLSGVNPMDQPSLRVKQLKRRVQRQVIRAVWRYRPRAGGFVWPGDYLKLELTQAPKLKSSKTSSDNLQSNMSEITYDNNLSSLPGSTQNTDPASKRKTKRKKKRTLVEWQVQPKKYLYAKHNAKVLKKKLERSQRSGNTALQQKVKDLSS